MSSVDILRSSTNLDVAKLNEILQKIQKMVTAVSGDLKKELVVYSPESLTRTTSGQTGEPNVKDLHNTVTDDLNVMLNPDATAYSSPLTYTNTGTLTFTGTGHKNIGNAKFDGSSYITVSDHSSLSPTSITISVYIKIPAVSSDCLIVKKDGQYELKATSTGISFRVNTGSWSTALTTSITSNTWTLITGTYTNGTLTLYKDGTSVATNSTTGNLSSTTNNLSIGGDGTSNLPSDTYLSHLDILDSDVGSAWITDWHTKRILDHNTKNPIVYFEFNSSEPSYPATNSIVS